MWYGSFKTFFILSIHCAFPPHLPFEARILNGLSNFLDFFFCLESKYIKLQLYPSNYIKTYISTIAYRWVCASMQIKLFKRYKRNLPGCTIKGSVCRGKIHRSQYKYFSLNLIQEASLFSIQKQFYELFCGLQ